MLQKLFFILLILVSGHSQAEDLVKIATGQSYKDTRYLYNLTLLKSALKITQPEYGDYRIKIVNGAIPNERRLNELKMGRQLNVAAMLYNQKWDQALIKVSSPIRQGLFNYRLLLTNKHNLEKFKQVNTTEDLHKLNAGLRVGWSTYDVMEHFKFKKTAAHTYESLFGMLNKNRFDYIPRGVHEIYNELYLRKDEYKNLVIEPNLAIYMPLPEFFFVSPKNQRLAARLELGIKRILDNGTIDRILEDFYGEYIRQADIKNRRVINIGNPLLPEDMPIHTPKYWRKD
ncbi:transporter substrate-binding domain-containing protein [Catenovulum maritimum]|uniref:Uncharacterized protein n=1 Tax=Catenovulum maritimum TaxID=1513271 RepID=A0A0J8H1J9_9ALTE|nr:transporter substrate-binding domain-containing protein [Catenovulum maritimum]KMT66908.1 hypothetical protein XM47_02060 [Catenovulum maritimum]